MLENNPHRKHAWWRDYKERGIYMITIVVRNREQLFGELNMNIQQPAVILNPLGQTVQDEWLRTAKIQQQKGRKIRLLGSSVMPDHFHGILFVEEKMDVGLGEVIRSFKTACTQARNRLLRNSQPSLGMFSSQPSLADNTQQTAEQRKALARMSHKQREAYYASHPELRPLFADNFDDTICYRNGQLDNIIHYILDNPRRAILKRANPQLFRLHQRVQVAGFACTTLGNQFLLDFPMKGVIQCSRRLTQQEIDRQKEQCFEEAERGTVFISASISEGEKQICKALREAGFPLIILLKDGFPKETDPHSKYFKPQGVYFEACAAGLLLLIEPNEELYANKDIETHIYAKTGALPHDTMRYHFLALNELAQKIVNSQK